MRRSLATQVALVTTLVAFVSVVVVGVIALPLARQNAERQAFQSLARQADVVADAAERSAAVGRPIDQPRIRRLLESQGISLAVLPAGDSGGGLLAPDELATLQSGGQVSVTREFRGQKYLVQARRVAGDQVVVLAQPLGQGRGAVGGNELIQRLFIGLLIGLAIGAGAGILLLRDERAGERRIRCARLVGSEGRQREFLLSISHELRTPLTAVKGYAEALSDGVIAGDDVVQVGNTMLGESLRLERLVSDLLDLARFGAQDFPLEIVDVDVKELVLDAALVWSDRSAPLGVSYTVEVPDAPVSARTDPMRLRQIIDNLSENALRMTPSGAPIVLALSQDLSGMRIEVRDGGPGLTDQDWEVAFEPAVLFSRYRGVRQVGSGVGLALVSKLASRLGATPAAGAAPEGGACFSVTFTAVTFTPAPSQR
ncbi:MAG: HAMP domain-containing sensor histidine kinase [Actinobacteria bacterium]|nr:HAMP domain-containing sensor histidine kinase [Actinomycetota bacterium]